MSEEIPTQFELETYEGRKVEERRDLAGGYCGTCDLSVHIKQLNDPKSWIHSSKDRWRQLYYLDRLKDMRDRIVVDGVEYVRKEKII